MRRLLLPMTVLLAFGPFTVFDSGGSIAVAAGQRSAQKKPVRPSRGKPAEIKLKDAPGTGDAPEATQASAPPQRGPTRIDFDDRLIQGQTNQSGAVYLYDRKELKTRSMVRKRESFREEIVKTVYDE